MNDEEAARAEAVLQDYVKQMRDIIDYVDKARAKYAGQGDVRVAKMKAEAAMSVRLDRQPMTAPRRFKVMMVERERRMHPDSPRDVPWEMLAPHEAQALANHDQTLERLNERGGLDPREMIAVIRGLSLRAVLRPPAMGMANAVRALRAAGKEAQC